MRPPIIVIDDVTLDLFDSVEHAERYLEPPDVEDLLVFDADGLRLQATVKEGRVPRVVIRPVEPPLDERPLLVELLCHNLKVAGFDCFDSDSNAVVELAVRKLGFTP